MQHNILWKGVEYYSLENCLVSQNTSGYVIDSAIVGSYRGKLYSVEYEITTNTSWETLSIKASCRHNNKVKQYAFFREANGHWKTTDSTLSQFNGCKDIDIPVTPFTNTLPIRRLNLSVGETSDIRVIYFDLLNEKISAVDQRYTKLSKTIYHYENIPNDFEADIEVDEHGLVVFYPSLFERKAILDASYPE